MARPSKHDVSVPKGGGYAEKREFYRSAEVAGDYDRHRRGSAVGRRRNRRKWAAIRKALATTGGVRTVLDLPCGTGRFTGPLARAGYRVVGSDISLEMMRVAVEAPADAGAEAGAAADPGRVLGFVQADAEGMPFRDGAVDCVVSIRFLFHVDPENRVRILREMRRVSARWVVLDYRHRYTWRWVKRRIAARLGREKRPFARVSRAEVEGEFAAAGLAVTRIVRVGARGFSDKWIVVGEPVE